MGRILPGNVDVITDYKYYEYWGLGEHLFTACLAFDSENNLISRGLSIKSFEDNFKRSNGKDRSKGRATKAAVKCNSSDEIRSPDRFDGVVTRKFKAKNKELLDFFYSDIAPRLGGEGNYTEKNDGKIIIFTYKLPTSYPLIITNTFFKFKSEYLPKMIDLEVDLFIR
jgi:hypothetical protein